MSSQVSSQSACSLEWQPEQGGGQVPEEWNVEQRVGEVVSASLRASSGQGRRVSSLRNEASKKILDNIFWGISKACRLVKLFLKE